MIRKRLVCVVCGNKFYGFPPRVAICNKCGSSYIFKYAKDQKGKHRILKGHYVLAKFGGKAKEFMNKK